MRLRASPRNLFWMITLWSVVIIFGVVDKLLNGEVNLLSEQSGLRHLLNLGSVRHLMLDNTSSILLDEEDTRSYIPVRFYPSHLCSTCLFIFFSVWWFLCGARLDSFRCEAPEKWPQRFSKAQFHSKGFPHAITGKHSFLCCLFMKIFLYRVSHLQAD